MEPQKQELRVFSNKRTRKGLSDYVLSIEKYVPTDRYKDVSNASNKPPMDPVMTNQAIRGLQTYRKSYKEQ